MKALLSSKVINGPATTKALKPVLQHTNITRRQLASRQDDQDDQDTRDEQTSKQPESKVVAGDETSEESTTTPKAKRKTMAELDEELRLKLEGLSGDGGASGVEYENGRAEGLKRGVKDNMFRVI